MSIRVSPRTQRSVATVAVVVATIGLAGCSSIGGRSFGDSTVTGSAAATAPATLNQPMPPSLGAPQSVQVASMQFLPPANVGTTFGGGNTLPPAPVGGGFLQPANTTSPIGMGAPASTVQTQALPALNASSPSGTTQAMPAQSSLAPLPAAPAAVALGTTPASAALPVNSSVPMAPAAANSNGYTHTIASGESLYTIARKYDVTTQSIVHANNLSSPDKITVGQKVIIPGRADLNTASPAPVQVASTTPQAMPTTATLPASRPENLGATTLQTAAVAPTPAATPTPAPAAPAAETTQVAAVAPQAAAEPAMSGSDKFRWPVSGRVITDFAASRGTGINIDVPEGSTVKAAENGTVIYVGSGVEGYGNLVLIRHPNGYVSAYAHLQGMNVAKGAVVNRGDAIGTVGMTGSVSKPQLHFELRKGATPVDPVPLLAS
jgi:murein DD-endopeptidase MepM/ murein hydrolase activator NlpD